MFRTTIALRWSDLDAQGHVNNAVYFEWVFEATPIDLMAWGPRSISASSSQTWTVPSSMARDAYLSG